MIGVYDSGIGGIAVLARLRRRYPLCDLLYFGDTAHLPYGDKTPSELRRLAEAALSVFRREGVSQLLVACGTVSTTLVESGILRADFPILGVVSPAVDCAVRFAPRRIAVLATRATCDSGVFGKKIREGLRSAEVLELPCPAFVPLIEAGRTSERDAALLGILRRELAPCIAFDPDAILLGCTHFVLLRPALALLFPRAAILDAGEAAVEALSPLHECGSGSFRCLVSGDPRLFRRAAKPILRIGRHLIKQVSADKY